MSKTIIAFTGLAGSGKDTAAKVLLDRGFTHISFAQPLKEVCAKASGLDISYFNDPALKDARLDLPVTLTHKELWLVYSKLGGRRRAPFDFKDKTFFTPREILQYIGTDLGRNMIHKDVWVSQMKKRMDEVPGNIVITDLRFQNESDLIGQVGGWVVRVFRPGMIRGTHESETVIMDVLVDIEIINNGTIDDLRKEVIKVLDQYEEEG